ncbi:MAG: tetratricopeptide repeat protein [Planctomycetes bacterium]|nr:tetratricopeptide repeat protein [Planctomycetota bacterium]
MKCALIMICAGAAAATFAAGCRPFEETLIIADPTSLLPANPPPAIARPEPRDAQRDRLAEANAASDAGEYELALSLFRELLAENPTLTTAYVGIGEVHLDRRDYARAEPAFARAVRLSPRSFDAQYGHGLALHMLERFIEAVKAYHRALTIRPDSFKTNSNLATAYLQMSEPSSAVIFGQKAVELDPSDGAARANLGAAYEQVGRSADAVAHYVVAMELLERTTPVMMNLINVLTREARYREAANTAETLVKLEPSTNAYERLGWCFFRLGEYDRSLDAYRSAVEIDPGHWPSLNGVAVNALNAWLLNDKRDEAAATEARDAFRRSLRVNPDQPRVIILLSKYGL